jgi:hypothetical protein
MLTLKENENMIVDDFLPENAMSNWNNYINGEGIPMFYAPHSINNNTTNDDYFFHIGYQGTVPQSNVYECFLENFAGIAGLRFDALAHIKISWYPKTIKIHEYETVSETKGVVDNLIYFSDTTDGYIMLPNDVKIQSVKNTLVVFKGNPTAIKHTSHTSGESWLRCVTHIQCYLNETPVSQGKIITY